MDENVETTNAEEEQVINALAEKVNYVRQWLDCAPDFPVLMESILVKMQVDRGMDSVISGDELNAVGQWIENFYKDLSAMMGTLEGHVMMSFPSGHENPVVQMTEKGAEWVKHHHDNPPVAGEQ